MKATGHLMHGGPWDGEGDKDHNFTPATLAHGYIRLNFKKWHGTYVQSTENPVDWHWREDE